MKVIVYTDNMNHFYKLYILHVYHIFLIGLVKLSG